MERIMLKVTGEDKEEKSAQSKFWESTPIVTR